jgi:sucrose-6-phosphate hydrolase SacC (GH32 family)
LYDSVDLRQWRYLQPILSGAIGTDCNMWECPVLLRFDQYRVLLVCPHPEAKYVYWIVGEWQNGSLQEHRRDKLDCATYVYAAQCLHDSVHDRYTATKLLLEKGHRRIAMINADLKYPAAAGRLDGYRKALKQFSDTV